MTFEMNPFSVWVFLAGVIVTLSAVCIALGICLLRYRHKHKVDMENRRKGVLEDLELATSDQLLNELRGRQGAPYLMLCPVNNGEQQGLTIEVHNIPPVPCLSILHMATALTHRELKMRGVEIPDLPGLDDLDAPPPDQYPPPQHD